MQALTDDEVEAMRSRLSAAALGVYRDEGIEAVSFRRIASVLGISYTLPYRYFDRKDALLTRVRIDCLQQFQREVLCHSDKGLSAREEIEQIVHSFTQFVVRSPDVYQLIFTLPQPDLVQYGDLMKERKAIFDYAVALFERCVTGGVLHGNARRLTHVLWGGLHGLFMLHSANQLTHGCDLPSAVAQLLETVLGPSPEQAAASTPRSRGQPAASNKHL